MRLLVCSDLHGNLPAFSALEDARDREAVDLTVILGDVCGYYFDEGEIVDRLRNWGNLVVLMGNHDDIYLRAAEGDEALPPFYRRKYGPALDRFLASDHQQVVTWLRSLPESWTDTSVRCAAWHGHPLDPLNGYVYPDTPLEHVQLPEKVMVLLGHTHYPMDRTESGRRWMNPGSVGQPRDGGPSCYAIIDADSRTVEHRALEYDVVGYADRVRAIAPRTPYLSDVLLRGNARG